MASPETKSNLATSRSQTTTSEQDLHKNEGFLKSMWHNLTNHPAHQGKDSTPSDGPKSTESKPDSKPETEKKKDGEGEPKKP